MRIPKIEALDLRNAEGRRNAALRVSDEWIEWGEITWPWSFLFDELTGMREAAKNTVEYPKW